MRGFSDHSLESLVRWQDADADAKPNKFSIMKSERRRPLLPNTREVDQVVHFLPTISVNEMSEAHNQFANISPLSGDFDLLHSQSRKVVEKCRCCLGNHAENQGGSNTACAHHIDAVVLNKAELP